MSPSETGQPAQQRPSNARLAWVLGGVALAIFLLALCLYRPA